MKEKIKNTLHHPLISGSAIIFLGTNLGNVFNFLFNLFMLRNLAAIDYGVLVGLISIITLFAQVADSITPFVVNYAAIYFAMKEVGKAKTLFFKVTQVSTVAGVLVLLGFVLFARPIGEFLNINNTSLITTVGFCVFVGYLMIVNKAFLQAKLAFTFIAIIVFLGSLMKFATGAFFVFSGFGVQGALFAFIIAFLIPYVMSFFPLKGLLHPSQKKEHIELRKMLKFGVSSVVTIFALTGFITTDILLVKHFFPADLAGLYAGMTIVGKIIYFFSAPIGSVMFPLIVQKYAKKQDYHGDFRLATFLVLLPSLLLTAAYLLVPHLVIDVVMKRREYLAASPYLVYVGVFFTFYSLTAIIVNFFLSIQKTYVFVPVAIFAIMQGFGIWFFHNTLLEVLMINILTSGLLLLTLLIYYGKISSSRK